MQNILKGHMAYLYTDCLSCSNRLRESRKFDNLFSEWLETNVVAVTIWVNGDEEELLKLELITN